MGIKKDKKAKPSTMSLSKHRKSGGYAHSLGHFTGKKAGKKVRRKGKGLTRKMRRMKIGKHINKYASSN